MQLQNTHERTLKHTQHLSPIRKLNQFAVTETDKEAEAACVAAIQAAFPGHAVLGEEGGVVSGDVSSEYLW